MLDLFSSIKHLALSEDIRGKTLRAFVIEMAFRDFCSFYILRLQKEKSNDGIRHCYIGRTMDSFRLHRIAQEH
jgi:hypothetical protein